LQSYLPLRLRARAAVLEVAVPGEKILMTSYGSGAGSDTYIFTVTPKIEKRDRLATLKARAMKTILKTLDRARGSLTKNEIIIQTRNTDSNSLQARATFV
jgi:hydroxymethylglutaryl-CoA synthase